MLNYWLQFFRDEPSIKALCRRAAAASPVLLRSYWTVAELSLFVASTRASTVCCSTALVGCLFLASPTKPFSFDSKTGRSFNGPGKCWDLAVTPQGHLLVAALGDGLKEYDATSFRDITTWKPDGDLLGQESSVFVTTVDVLSDGRAVVGLHPSLILLLRRDVVNSGECGGNGSGSSATEAWQMERRVAELPVKPRHLSSWGDRLLAVLEDRWDESKELWLPGPGLVLLNLCEDDKQVHSRQQLDYDAHSVALTDRGIVVQSNDQVVLTDALGSLGGTRKCYIVECYSHSGVRLWRHEVDRGLKVMSIITDAVGRVVYAAKRGSVVALSIDDGREISTAIVLSIKDNESPYAIALDKAAQCILALISYDGDQPNTITTFSAA